MNKFSHKGTEKKELVTKLFNDIAKRYDFLNHLFSFGIDYYWRKRLVNKVQPSNQTSILDIATGTGDVAFKLALKCNQVVGLDIAKNMIEIAKIKQSKKQLKNINFIIGDAEKLPFEDKSFDYIEEYYNIHGLNFTVLRYGSIYGERSDYTNGISNIIQNAIKTGKISYFGSDKSIREYVHVSDIARASVDILHEKYKNKHIILSGQKALKVHDFLKILANILNISNDIKFRNEKYTGHYEITPFTYELKFGEKLILDKYVDYRKGLTALVNEIKKNSNEKNH